MAVDTSDGRNAVRGSDQHTGPEPTHDNVEKLLNQAAQDDLAARDAILKEQRGNASAHAITGQTTPNDASGPAEVKPR